MILTWWRRARRARRLDEIAERREPSPEEQSWLQAQADRDPSVSDEYARLRRWQELARQAPRPAAPGGFAERVMLRARAEPVGVIPEPRAAPRGAWIGLAAAAGVAAFVVGIQLRPGSDEFATSGAAGFARSAPDLVIRAPDIGAAQAREVFEDVVTRHGGQSERQESAVMARVSRQALLPLLESLSEHGDFEVDRPASSGLPAVLTLRLELGGPVRDDDATAAPTKH